MTYRIMLLVELTKPGEGIGYENSKLQRKTDTSKMGNVIKQYLNV